MNIFRKGVVTAVAMAGLIAMGAPASSAQNATEEPIITFKTNIYDTYGAQNVFSIVLGATETDYFDIDCGSGAVETEVGPAVFDSETSSVVGTTISCTVNSNGIVRIYGDASKIDYLNATGCYIDWIEMDECVNLSILDLSHNELKRLDLSPFSNLQAIYLSDNPFTAETPLKVGGNKPNLQILEIDIIDHLDQSFNLSDYPALVTFDAYHNLDLYNIDPTGCPDLMVLSVELTNVSSIDVSKNPLLMRLNISDTRITNIDLSNNPALQNFHGQHTSGTINTDVKLASLDVTKNPELLILDVAGNSLSSIDLTQNTKLTNLNLSRNSLTSIDLSKNTALYSVNLAYNDLDYTTLPLPEQTWGEYYYYRWPMDCSRSYALGSEIDFSSRVLRDGTTTTVKVYKNPLSEEPSELDENYYTYADGKVVFNEIPADSVYIQFENTAFTEYTIRSAQFKVKNSEDIGKPSKVLGFTIATSQAGSTRGFKVGMDNASVDNPKTFYVDYGDGVMHEFQATSVNVPEQNNLTIDLPSDYTATEYALYIPEGESFTALSMDGVTLSSIDLEAATELRWLTVRNTNLSRIDLSTNRCLQTLDLSGNRLSNVSLAGVYGDYEKTVLTDINLSGNRLVNLEMVLVSHIRKLDLHDNYLTSFSLRDYDVLEELDLSGNRLAGEMSLTYLANARKVDLSGNSITSLVTVDMPYLETFDVSDNNLTLETLPYFDGVADGVYVYAPQKDFTISENAPGVNLSAQNRVVEGVSTGTTFTWKTTDGQNLVEGTDMECTNGATRFLDAAIGKVVYCEMTNVAFPDLTGTNVYKTTNTTVQGAPTTVLASFTTTENASDVQVTFTGTKASDVYIDWRGDGTEYMQYPINGDSYTTYESQTVYAGANVKVYTYDTPADITQFSIYNAEMSSMDASPMTNLVSFAVGGAKLTEENIVFPNSKSTITELNLIDNAFSTLKFTDYPNLYALFVTGNSYETLDVSGLTNLGWLYAGRNKMQSITFGNNTSLMSVDLTDNKLESISLEGLPALTQLFLANNSFHTIDLSPVQNKIVALDIQNNSFDFSTLPIMSDYPSLYSYRFVNQAPLEVTCEGGVVDLSSQASVNGTATEFYWFLGDVTYDSETGELIGELLDGTSEDPEYTCENGVTTFHYSFDQQVVCVMTNSEFENLMLYTRPVTVNLGGVEAVAADGIDADAPVDVYSISGIRLRSNVTPAEATRGLAPGFYIVGDRKVLVK